MRTSLSRIVLAALLFASAALASCGARGTPAPAAPAPTLAPAAKAPAPAPTRAPPVTRATEAAGPQQTVIVEKQLEVEQPPAAMITTPTPAGRPAPAATGGPSDWDRIRAAGRIVVGMAPQYRPFAYYNADAELDGFDVAVVQEIGRRLGLAVVTRDVDPSALMDRLSTRQIDLALPSPVGQDVADASGAADFTKPFHICRDVMLASEGTAIGEVRAPADLGGRAIGVVSGSRHEAWLQKTLLEPEQPAAAAVLTFTLVSQLVGALQAGQIDLAIIDAVQAMPLLKEGGVRLVGQDLNRQNRSLALPRGSDRLRSDLDRVLAEMAADGTLAGLASQYLGLELADLAPLQTPTPERTATATPSSTPTAGPPGGSFAADPIRIEPGKCTRFTWNVENVREVYFYARGERWEGSPATGQESRTVCPAATTTYELRIVDADGATRVRSITILVEEQPQAPIAASLMTSPVSAIRLGECLTVSWEVRGDPTMVQIVRDQVVLWANAPDAGSLQDCPPAAGAVVYSVLGSVPGQTIQTQRVITVNP
jgi:ABC-type amino acid transport substrate-binding protein